MIEAIVSTQKRQRLEDLRPFKGMNPEFQGVGNEETLEFDSKFESGNLDIAVLTN